MIAAEKLGVGAQGGGIGGCRIGGALQLHLRFRRLAAGLHLPDVTGHRQSALGPCGASQRQPRKYEREPHHANTSTPLLPCFPPNLVSHCITPIGRQGPAQAPRINHADIRPGEGGAGNSPTRGRPGPVLCFQPLVGIVSHWMAFKSEVLMRLEDFVAFGGPH